MPRTHENVEGALPSAATLPFAALLESAFATDLSAVRVVLNARGPCGLLGVEAMTWGDTVAFASAKPTLTQVAHETAHILQYRLALNEGRRPAGLSRPGDPAEAEASAAARAVADGLPVWITVPATSALCCDWPGLTVEDRTFIEGKGAPPDTAEAAIADFEWSILLRKWAYSYGDQFVINVVTFVHELVWTYGRGAAVSLGDISGMVCGPGAMWPIEWPPDICEQFTVGDDGVWVPATADEEAVKQAMYATAVSWIDQMWYPTFRDDVALIQQQASGPLGPAAGRPVAVAITRDDIERQRDFVRDVSQMNLKAAQTVGDTLAFVQSGDLVLVGEGFPRSWVECLSAAGGANGRIIIRSRGGTFSTGEIAVQGCVEQEAFKAAIAEFSKKKVTFETAPADAEAADVEPAGAPPASFDVCWADPVWKPRYVEWVERQLQGENVHFITAVEESYAPAPTMDWADYLAHEFIGDEAAQQVNIGALADQIRSRLAAAHASGEAPPDDLFRDAVAEVKKTMLVPDYPRFAQSMLVPH